MDLEFIPRKTDKGRAEVQTRSFHVGPRERSVLIMVDGKTPARLLVARLAFIEKANEILGELREGGFIDFDGPEELPPLGTSVAAGETPLTEALHASRQFARAFIIDALGPGGDDLARKLEACPSREALLPLLKKCRRFLKAYVNRRTAQEFWNGLGEDATAVPVLVERPR